MTNDTDIIVQFLSKSPHNYRLLKNVIEHTAQRRLGNRANYLRVQPSQRHPSITTHYKPRNGDFLDCKKLVLTDIPKLPLNDIVSFLKIHFNFSDTDIKKAIEELQ